MISAMARILTLCVSTPNKPMLQMCRPYSHRRISGATHSGAYSATAAKTANHRAKRRTGANNGALAFRHLRGHQRIHDAVKRQCAPDGSQDGQKADIVAGARVPCGGSLEHRAVSYTHLTLPTK